MAVLLMLLASPSACTRPSQRSAEIPAVDLLRRFQDAERRPVGATFERGEHTFGGRSRASLVVPAESRMTWRLLVPHRARLRFYAAVPDTSGPASIAFRIGVSDGRLYNTLVEPTITSADTAARGWIPVEADLSMYAGRKLSLFYRPDTRRWTIVIGTHVLSGGPRVAYLGNPALLTDVEGAREYQRRVAKGVR